MTPGNIIKLSDDMPDTFLANGEEWKPEYWVAQGFQRNWGDAAVMSDYFEVLRKEAEPGGSTVFVILCPSFLRRPLRIETADPNAWGSY